MTALFFGSTYSLMLKVGKFEFILPTLSLLNFPAVFY